MNGAAPLQPAGGLVPGEVLTAEGTLVLNADRSAVSVEVANTGDRPIQVGSHFHFFETNRALRFDRAQAYGRRLDIPSGTAVRFEPGERRTVQLIPLAGRRIAQGFNGLVNGALDGAEAAALSRARAQGFEGAEAHA